MATLKSYLEFLKFIKEGVPHHEGISRFPRFIETIKKINGFLGIEEIEKRSFFVKVPNVIISRYYALKDEGTSLHYSGESTHQIWKEIIPTKPLKVTLFRVATKEDKGIYPFNDKTLSEAFGPFKKPLVSRPTEPISTDDQPAFPTKRLDNEFVTTANRFIAMNYSNKNKNIRVFEKNDKGTWEQINPVTSKLITPGNITSFMFASLSDSFIYED